MAQHTTSPTRAVLTTFALATGALLAGCAGNGGWSEPGGSMSNSEAAKLSHAQNLEQRVMAALRADPRVGAQGLRVEGKSDGTVIIGGTPANGTGGRDLALAIARNVPGVRKVVNSMVMN